MDGWTHTCVRSGTEFSTLNLCWQEEHNICFVVIFIFVFSCPILVVEPNKIKKKSLFKQKCMVEKYVHLTCGIFFSVGCLVRVGKHQ